jgi:hypothetical protein
MGFDQAAWDRIQADARRGKWGDYSLIRNLICEREAQENPGGDIGSSDINHLLFGFFHGREDMSPTAAVSELMDELPTRFSSYQPYI